MNTERCEQNRCPRCGAVVPSDSPAGLCPKCLLSEAGAATGSPHGAGVEDVPPIEKVRAAFPQLEIIELIGKGGMGFVYKARQPHLDRFVALKILPDKLARDPLFAERFNREGRVLAKLNHPNIVAIYDFGQAGEFYYLLMEYVDGVNLRQAMNLGRFSPSEALKIVPKICEALQYAHEHGILHRDIKPENILIDSQGNVKITDFGIAKLIGDQPKDITLTGTGTVLGTPHYMAPEQIESPTKVDQRADIYSLGVVFYEMLTGELPLGRFEPPSARTPVPKEVDEVVFKSLEKDKEKRFKSAQEVKTKVEHIGENGSGAEPPVYDKSAQTPYVSPKVSGYAVASALLVSIGILVFFSFIFIAGSKGINSIAAILTLLFSAIFCIAGTILGWVGLSKMRAEPGRWIGLPLAVFGALAFPITFLFMILVGIPFTMVATHEPAIFLNIVALALPGIVIGSAAFMVLKTLAWAKGKEKVSSTAKWNIFAVAFLLTVVLITLRLLNHGNPSTVKQTIRQNALLTDDKNPFRKGGEALPAGLIEIVGVCESSDPRLWWSVDGTKQVFPEISEERSGYNAGKNEREIKIAFKVGKMEKFAGMKFLCPGATTLGYAIPSSSDGNFTNTIRAVYPKTASKAVVYIGAASGDWDTVAKTSSTDYNPSWVLNRDGEQWRIQFLNAIEDKDGNINVSFSYDIPNTDLYTWRIVATTADGVEHKALKTTGLPNTIKSVFSKELAAGIKEYRIQVQKFKWASFDVALYPEFGNLGK